MLRKVITKPYKLNCLTAMAILLVKKKIIKIVYFKRHFMGVTKNGNLIHFKSTEREDRWLPFLFEGYLELVGRYQHRRQIIELQTLKDVLWFVIRK